MAYHVINYSRSAPWLCVLWLCTTNVYAELYCPDTDTDGPHIEAAVRMVVGKESALTQSVSAINNASTSIIYQRLGDLADRISNLSTTQAVQADQLAKQEITATRDALVQHGIAQEQLRAEHSFGKQGIDSCCRYEDIAQNMAIGRAEMRQQIATFGKAMDNRSRGLSSPSSTGSPTKGNYYKVQDLLKVSETEFTIETLYPKTITLDADSVIKVQTIHQQVIDPLPPNKISSAVKESPAGQNYEALRLTYEKTKEAPRQAQAFVDGMKTPAFPISEWARATWVDMGKSGDPDGTVDGKLSYDALLDLFVRARMENPKWFQKVSGAGEGGEGGNDVWQLRQINLSSAILMEIKYRKMRLMEHMVELLAQGRANDVDDKYLPNLGVLLERAESQQ